MTEISIFGNGPDRDLEQELMEATTGSTPEHRDMVERGMTAYDTLARRNLDLEQALNRAILAIKARDVEIENLRLQLVERDNRIASIQAVANEREEHYLAERDAAINEAAEYRAIHVQIKHLYERVQLPLPHLPPNNNKKKAKSDVPPNSEEAKE